MRQFIRNLSSRTLLTAAALSLLAVAGCDQVDPLKRPYMWHEGEVNPQNIAAMAANPADLTHGRDTAKHNASLETDSVEKLWSGKPTPLLQTTGMGSTGTTGSSGGGAAPAGGGS
jgi:hypothetical protein